MSALGLDLFRLLVLVTVVDRNGYSAAAKHLNVSQATVSFHVQALERLFGSKLLVYERRAIHLTPPGEEVYRAARMMLQEADRLAQAVRDIRHGHRGRVVVGASMAFEQAYFLERVVAPFYRGHEGTRLSLRFGHSVAHVDAVQRHELDLAYVIGWQVPSGVHYEPLHEAFFTFLVSPEHPLARRDERTVEEIAEAGFIAAPLDSREWSHYARVLRDCGLDSVDPVLEVDGMQAAGARGAGRSGGLRRLLPALRRRGRLPCARAGAGRPAARQRRGRPREPGRRDVVSQRAGVRGLAAPRRERFGGDHRRARRAAEALRAVPRRSPTAAH